MLAEQLLAKGDFVSSGSPDGKHLLFGLSDIFLLPLEGEHKPVPYLQTKFNEGSAVFSPDGKWIVYDSMSQAGGKSTSRDTRNIEASGKYRRKVGYFLIGGPMEKRSIDGG